MELLLTITLLLLFGCVSSQLPPTPCPNVFKYSSDNRNVFGLVLAHNTVPYRSQYIEITLGLPLSNSLSNFGQIQVLQGNDEIIQNILRRKPILYRVNFPFNTLPRVVNINFNGESICQGYPVEQNIITLQHTFKVTHWPVFLNSQQSTAPPYNYQNYQTTKRPQYTTVNYQDISDEASLLLDRQKYPIQNSVYKQPNNYNDCGVEKKILSLIHNGAGTTKGEWPWIVAMYKRRNGGDIYQCGATLISDKSVVTAAHCVVGANQITVPLNSIYLKLGAFDLEDTNDDTVLIRQLSKIKVHELNKGITNDIAILVMDQSVTFTEFIRPACIWSTDSDQKYVDGKEGVVVGWGLDENGNQNVEPSLVKVPILSMAKCREANIQYFPLTSENTLCAGGKDGRGPCKGDSGDGLYVYENKKWTIRGLVSLSVSKTNTCDLSEYVVYTDVAMFSDWIRRTME